MHPNAQAVMRGFQAFAEGDTDTLRLLFAEDAVWHGGGRNRFSGDYAGIDEILGLFGEITQEATIDNRPHALLADDDHVVVLVEATLTRDGESLESNTVFVFHVDDGKATEVWTIFGDPYAVDEFWGA